MQNMKPFKLVYRLDNGPLADLSDEQLSRIGELALNQ